MALHLAAAYAHDPAIKISLCKKAAALHAQQQQQRGALQLEHAAAAAAAAQALLEKTTRTNPAAAAAADAAADADADASATSPALLTVGCYVTLSGLSTQHLNGVVCRVTGALDNGRVAVVAVDAPAALQHSRVMKGLSVKPCNCSPLPHDQQDKWLHQLSSQPQLSRQQRHPDTLLDLSPLHTVVKAIEIAVFAHAANVRPARTVIYLPAFTSML
jgi:hypothetical protein